MVSKKTSKLVTGVMVPCMLGVVWSEFQHGTPASELHQITAAQLTLGSTIIPAGSALVYFGYSDHQNAIVDVAYAAVPDTIKLRLDGLTYRST